MKSGVAEEATGRVRSRERLLAAAAELTSAGGWASLTTGRLAADLGVGRQTVYDEVGSKAGLAEALVLRETDKLAGTVGQILEHHPGDAAAGVTDAFCHIVEAARVKPLLKTVLGGPDGDELLSLITTRSQAVPDRAVTAVTPMLRARYAGLGLSEQERAVFAETFVRLLLSHVVQPGGPIERTAESVRRVLGRMLDR
ncbi:TetR family transcriptional regulator [Amycolatopsis rhabdoformis]|uniref:TetR family transcriptional regulator n=1 Tax=Amycolatopsis rhabdoformis TaxID=1448059 RepID=A0ABZ1IMI8_9PSEU|nr:TetR family transcriptional regulator [Amycolatopsis rhabdoformis]WSE34953.1 TetR family transcriptional regulator [Amycolatopsis rhabdoformis]